MSFFKKKSIGIFKKANGLKGLQKKKPLIQKDWQKDWQKPRGDEHTGVSRNESKDVSGGVKRKRADIIEFDGPEF